MKPFNRKYRKICTYYKKELDKCHKTRQNNANNLLDYFITYIRGLRDFYLLNSKLEKDLAQDRIFQSLCIAVDKYELYNTCFEKYYTVNERGVNEAIDKTISKEEVLFKYQTEKELHWRHFWQVVMENIESWCKLDDITV